MKTESKSFSPKISFHSVSACDPSATFPALASSDEALGMTYFPLHSPPLTPGFSGVIYYFISRLLLEFPLHCVSSASKSSCVSRQPAITHLDLTTYCKRQQRGPSSPSFSIRRFLCWHVRLKITLSKLAIKIIVLDQWKKCYCSSSLTKIFWGGSVWQA